MNGFQGELMFCCKYTGPLPEIRVNHGDAIGQLIPVKRVEMDAEEISQEEYDILCAERNGERGEGGFGSTTGN